MAKKVTRESIRKDMLKESDRKVQKREMLNKEWYTVRSMMGYTWALFYFLLGGREAGKSYAVTKFYVNQWKKYHRPFYWLRLTETSALKLLKNNAEKLIDPDIRRHYHLDLETVGDGVYEVQRDESGKVIKKELMARVLALSTFYNDKGSGYFDKDFLDDPMMYYNICLDEMNREKGEKKSFDIVYCFVNQIENLVRSTKQRLRIICIGNTLEEASDLLCAFNFIPDEFGRYKLKSKRAVIEYIEPSEKYKERRKGTVADILTPNESTFSNEIEIDKSLLYKGRLISPRYTILFYKDIKYTVWDDNVIKEYNGEKCRQIPMRPYLDAFFDVDTRNNIMLLYDTRSFLFANLITAKRFKKDLSLLRPKK